MRSSQPPKIVLPSTGRRVPLICHALLATSETTKQLRQTNGKLRSPWKDQGCSPLRLPCPGRECGARAYRPANGAWAAFARLQAGPAASASEALNWSGTKATSLPVSVPAVQAAEAPGRVPARGDLGEIRPAGCHHHHRHSPGRLWAGYPFAQTTADSGAWTTGQQAPTLPHWVRALEEGAARASPYERPPTAPDTRPLPPRDQEGHHLLKAGGAWARSSSAPPTECARTPTDATTSNE
jgi:hypothetical protein